MDKIIQGLIAFRLALKIYEAFAVEQGATKEDFDKVDAEVETKVKGWKEAIKDDASDGVETG